MILLLHNCSSSFWIDVVRLQRSASGNCLGCLGRQCLGNSFSKAILGGIYGEGDQFRPSRCSTFLLHSNYFAARDKQRSCFTLWFIYKYTKYALELIDIPRESKLFPAMTCDRAPKLLLNSIILLKIWFSADKECILHCSTLDHKMSEWF